MSERESADVPLPALERLSTYIRCLMQLEREGVSSVSSQDMETHTGVSAAQFRKDLSYFGEFGKRGIGYDVSALREKIAELLQINQEQNVILVGAGHLGSALIAYPGWRSYHFKIAAVFDKDPDKVGKSIRRVPIRGIDDLKEANKQIGAKIGILAIPAWEAQEVADKMVAAGITGIINFAPLKLQLPPHVIEREVCFICELAILSHLIHHPGESGANGKHGRSGRRKSAGSDPDAATGAAADSET